MLSWGRENENKIAVSGIVVSGLTPWRNSIIGLGDRTQ